MKKSIVVALVLASVSVCAFLAIIVRSRNSRSAQHIALKITMPTNRPSTSALHAAFPGDSRTVFEHSDRLTLYAIDPDPVGVTKQATSFHGYPVVGQTEIMDKKVKDALVAHFYNGMADKNIHSAGCFEPHHALRARRGQRIVDLVICFSCSGVDIYYGKQEGHTAVSPAPWAFYNAVLRNADVPLSTS